MKSLTLLSCVAMLLVSCKKDRPENSGSNTIDASLLLGKWVYTQDTIKIYKNNVLMHNYADGGLVDGINYQQFNKSGGLQGIGPNVSNFTYTVYYNVISFYFPKQTVGAVTLDAYTQKATIQMLSTDKLKILYDDTSIDPDSTIYRTTEAAYFKKQ